MSTNVIPFRGRRIPAWTFGERARKVRREVGATQEEFARQLGVSAPTYSAWESGRNVPSNMPEVAVRLEQISGVAREWFLGWADDAPRPDGPGGEGQPVTHRYRRLAPVRLEAVAA